MGSTKEDATGEIKPKYNFLGQTGVRVSELCLGTSTFGGQQHESGRPACDDATAMDLLNRFVEAGGNYINTADMYSHGEAERVVGQWLQGRQDRESLVITGKAGTHVDKSDPNDVGCSRKHLVYSLERSLKNLNTHYLDVYNLHRYDPAVPIDRLVRTMDDLVRSGKIRSFGLSNFTAWQMQKIVDYCKFMHLDGPVVMESEYNLLAREVEYEVCEVCKQEGIAFTPWGALKGGWLGGKISRDTSTPPSDSRIAWSTNDRVTHTITSPDFNRFNNDQTFQLLDVMKDIGQLHGKTVAQVALRWLLQKDVVPSVIIGARTIKQLDDSLGALGWTLTQQQMSQLDEASQFRPLPDCYYIVQRAIMTR